MKQKVMNNLLGGFLVVAAVLAMFYAIVHFEMDYAGTTWGTFAEFVYDNASAVFVLFVMIAAVIFCAFSNAYRKRS